MSSEEPQPADVLNTAPPATGGDAAPAAVPSDPTPSTRARVLSRDDLPPYTLSLLQIGVPVSVTLAMKKQPVARIVELGPGAIIQFEKSCEEMLDLEVGGQVIGEGEPVKIGEKFGLRISSMKSPGERFLRIRPKPPLT